MGNKDAGNLSMQESVSPAQNEMYADFIVKYMDDFQEDLGDVPGFSFQKINGIYGGSLCTLDRNWKVEYQYVFLQFYSKMLYAYGSWRP